MNFSPRGVALACLLAAGESASAKEETFVIFDERKIVIDVPDGYLYSSGFDPNGAVVAKLADAKKTISLEVVFVPDARARLGTEDSQKDFVAEQFQQYAEGSVEKSYEFVNFKSRSSSGLYCAFTDVSLVGKTPPPNEFLHVTVGVKAWAGCAAIFTLFSQDTTSKEYSAVLKLIKDSLEEKKPLGPTL